MLVYQRSKVALSDDISSSIVHCRRLAPCIETGCRLEGLSLVKHREIATRHNPHRLRADFDNLCSSLMLSLKKVAGERYVIALTSQYRGGGLSTLVAGIAGSLSRHGSGVLVVDAAGGPNSVGVIMGFGERATDARFDRITFGANDEYVAHADQGPDLLVLGLDEFDTVRSVDRLKQVIDSLRARYEIILIDAGIVAAASFVSWQHLADRVFLVVDSTVATVESLSRLKKELFEREIRIDGAIINKRKYYIPHSVYDRLF